MSDLIDRQAAIDFIDAGRLGNPNEPRWSDKEIVNFLKSRPSVQRWIPCSERLPEEKEALYWICTDGGYQCQVRWTEDAGFGKHGNWRWHHMDYPQFSKVIAWMELPEPYQEEK